MHQNNIQLRGIVQGMFTFAQSGKNGGADGWYPGVDRRGRAITPTLQTWARIDPNIFGQHNAIQAYADDRDDPQDIALAEMNDPDTGEGFMQYAFAELLTGDFIPGGRRRWRLAPGLEFGEPFVGSNWMVNPNDPVKTRFEAGDPGDTGRFDMSKVSYTILNVAVDGLKEEWRETANPNAIMVADRAVGNGDTLGQPGASASSVWTQPGSGRWRGGQARNDASTWTVLSPRITGEKLTYADITFENDTVHNLFAHPDDETLDRNDAGEIESDQGVLFDQDERGRDTGV